MAWKRLKVPTKRGIEMEARLMVEYTSPRVLSLKDRGSIFVRKVDGEDAMEFYFTPAAADAHRILLSEEVMEDSPPPRRFSNKIERLSLLSGTWDGIED